MLAMTSDFRGQSRNSADIRGALERIARAGFSHIHWCHEFGSSWEYSVYEMLQIKNWCRELGLLVKGVHASAGEKTSDLKSYISQNEFNRLAGIDLIKNRIGMACILGTDAVVLHCNITRALTEKNSECREALLQPVFKSFDELGPYCRTRGIKLCIENAYGTAEQYCPFYDRLFERYGADYMGLCIDTGHAYHDCGEKCFEYAQRYNDRVFMIHADDNHGDSDAHLLPFEGGFDWEGFAPILARSPYQFPVVMEPSCTEEGDDTAWLKKAFDAGSRFSAMVEKYR